MKEVVTARQILKLTKIARYNFVRGPLLKELLWLIDERELLFIAVTIMEHHNCKYGVNIHLCLLASDIRIPVERGRPALVRASVVSSLSPSNHLTNAEWLDKNSEVELVMFPNMTDRNGFFIIAGGSYTLFHWPR